MITLLLFSYYQSLSGRKEDRIAVCVTSPDLKEDMFLGSPVVTSSEGNVKKKHFLKIALVVNLIW